MNNFKMSITIEESFKYLNLKIETKLPLTPIEKIAIYNLKTNKKLSEQIVFEYYKLKEFDIGNIFNFVNIISNSIGSVFSVDNFKYYFGLIIATTKQLNDKNKEKINQVTKETMKTFKRNINDVKREIASLLVNIDQSTKEDNKQKALKTLDKLIELAKNLIPDIKDEEINNNKINYNDSLYTMFLKTEETLFLLLLRSIKSFIGGIHVPLVKQQVGNMLTKFNIKSPIIIGVTNFMALAILFGSMPLIVGISSKYIPFVGHFIGLLLYFVGVISILFSLIKLLFKINLIQTVILKTIIALLKLAQYMINNIEKLIKKYIFKIDEINKMKK